MMVSVQIWSFLRELELLCANRSNFAVIESYELRFSGFVYYVLIPSFFMFSVFGYTQKVPMFCVVYQEEKYQEISRKFRNILGSDSE